MLDIIAHLLCAVIFGNIGLLLAWGLVGIAWFIFRREDTL
jgi:hypothetical protein